MYTIQKKTTIYGKFETKRAAGQFLKGLGYARNPAYCYIVDTWFPREDPANFRKRLFLVKFKDPKPLSELTEKLKVPA